MTSGTCIEDVRVQQTPADYLRADLGWEAVYAHHNEDFGMESLLGRASKREVVLRLLLRERLAVMIPGLCRGPSITARCGRLLLL